MFRFNNKIRKTSSDEELMQMVCRGNRDAFEDLYNRYFEKLVKFSKRLLYENEELAEDLVQEVFIKIIDKPQAFNTEKVFTTWIYTLAKNLCFNNTRNEQNRQRLLDENFNRNEEVYMHLKTDFALLKIKIAQVFQTLNEREKLIFVLRFEHDLSIKKIAEIAEIPEGSVKSGIFYLLKKVSAHLKELKYEY